MHAFRKYLLYFMLLHVFSSKCLWFNLVNDKTYNAILRMMLKSAMKYNMRDSYNVIPYSNVVVMSHTHFSLTCELIIFIFMYILISAL